VPGVLSKVRLWPQLSMVTDSLFPAAARCLPARKRKEKKKRPERKIVKEEREKKKIRKRKKKGEADQGQAGKCRFCACVVHVRKAPLGPTTGGFFE